MRQRASQSIASAQLCVPRGVTRHDVPNQHDAKRVQSFAASCRQLCSVRFCAQSASHDDDPRRHPASILQPAMQTSFGGVVADAGADGADGTAAEGDANGGIGVRKGVPGEVAATAGLSAGSLAGAFVDGSACRPRGAFAVVDGFVWLRCTVTAGAVVEGAGA